MNDVQSNLFGEAITISRSVDHAAIRDAAMKRAQKNQSVAFLIEFKNFVLKYAETHATWSTEDVRHAYNKTSLPKPICLKTGKIEWKAAGGVIQSLSRQGKIVFVDTKISKTRRADIKVFRKA